MSNIVNARDIAKELIIGVHNNVMNGRMSGEIIPYYYTNILDDDGIAISLHYDSKIGLYVNFYGSDFNKDLDNDDDVIEYQKFLNVVNMINEIVFFPDDLLTDEFYERVSKYQISKDEANEKTQWLFKNNCIKYI
jgi:hypothetical protein